MRERVAKIVAETGRERGQLLEVLGRLQQGRNYLKKEELLLVAEEMNIPPAEIYGTATFYSLYATAPRGQHVIRVCENAPCHIDGAAAVLKAIAEYLAVPVGGTTADNRFTLETTSCLGICSAAPAIMINDEVHGRLTPERAVDILKNLS